jgi:hypothetical protein
LSKPEYTLIIRYRKGGGRHKRVIPWNWYPSGDEVFECIRRLRSQCPECYVVSATLTQEVLVERYHIPELEEDDVPTN